MNLSKTVGIFVVGFYLLSSTALFLAKQSEDDGDSCAVAASCGDGDAPDAKWAWLFKNISHSSRKIRFVMNTILLLGLGCSMTLYGVQIFVDSTPAYANQRTVSLPSVFLLKYYFKTGSVRKEDITAISTPAYSKSGADYAAIQEDTIRAYRDEIQKKPIHLVEIVGFADAVGSSENNQRLSRGRAETIQALLISAGVPEKMISIRAVGEQQLSCANSANCLFSNDRRVDVYFR